MPFIFPQTSRKTRRRYGAFPEFRAARTTLEIPERTEVPTYSPSLQSTQPLQDTDSMGRRSQKPQSSACKDTQDIGAMLQRPAAAKMAEFNDGSDESERPTPDHIKQNQQGETT
ncbi:Hypothetical predicted protein [Pelobates cultripes]|uniref:Uncharacterized protein n=1 Tax=Pelobates cultripes TaxID=61616 RepID=A0AAD1TPM8_PELCU|nr:Hypothetical predicted protein [Pelobates cultripes]